MNVLLEIFNSEIELICAEVYQDKQLIKEFATPSDPAYIHVYTRGYEDQLINQEPPGWLQYYPEYLNAYLNGLEAANTFITNA
jgi:hypothetical protein